MAVNSFVFVLLIGISLPVIDAFYNKPFGSKTTIFNNTEFTRTIDDNFKGIDNKNAGINVYKKDNNFEELSIDLNKEITPKICVKNPRTNIKFNANEKKSDKVLCEETNEINVNVISSGFTGFLTISTDKDITTTTEMTSEFFTSVEGRESWERIVGGFKAANGSIPYQVSLRVWGVWHFCGASLVTPRVILTAAHCVDRMKPQYFQAVVGTNQLRQGGNTYDIRKIVVHEEYDDDIIKNDIAILFTEKEIDFGSIVDAVELNDEPVMKGEELVLTGWGSTSYPGRLPNDLMQLELRSITYEECKEAHKDVNAVFETQICALTKEGEGACHGDSGGPLVREGRQIGIVSWGIPCARGKPDVYTKVEAYMRWIERTLYDDDEDHVRYIHDHRKRKTNRH